MSSTDIMDHGLATRIAGQSEIERLLRSRESAQPRSAVARVMGVSPLTSDERPWYLDALGETLTSRMLSQLPSEWTVLHSVAIGAGTSDVDHLVVGPGGVFTINTNHHFGQAIVVGSRSLTVGGIEVPELRSCAYEAERATITLSRILPPEVDVSAVLACVHPRSITVTSSTAIVNVLDASTLVKWLKARPVVLTTNQVALIAMVVADPATWHSGRPLSTVLVSGGGDMVTPAVLTQRFTEIDRQVRSARRTRRAWIAVGIAAATTTAAVTIPALAELVVAILG